MVYKAYLECQSGSGMEQVAVKTLKGMEYTVWALYKLGGGHYHQLFYRYIHS